MAQSDTHRSTPAREDARMQPEADPVGPMLDDIVAILGHLVDTIPAAAGMAPRVAMLRRRLADMRVPPDRG